MGGLKGITKTSTALTLTLSPEQLKQISSNQKGFATFIQEQTAALPAEQQESSTTAKEHTMLVARYLRIIDMLHEYIEAKPELCVVSTPADRRVGFKQLRAKVAGGDHHQDAMAAQDMFEKIAYVIMRDGTVPIETKREALDSLYTAPGGDPNESPLAKCGMGMHGELQSQYIKLNLGTLSERLAAFAHGLALETAIADWSTEHPGQPLYIHFRNYYQWNMSTIGLGVLGEVKITDYDLHHSGAKPEISITSLTNKIDSSYKASVFIESVMVDFVSSLEDIAAPLTGTDKNALALLNCIGIKPEELDKLYTSVNGETYRSISALVSGLMPQPPNPGEEEPQPPTVKYIDYANGKLVFAVDNSVPIIGGKEFKLPVAPRSDLDAGIDIDAKIRRDIVGGYIENLLPQLVRVCCGFTLDKEFLRYKLFKKMQTDKMLKTLTFGEKTTVYLLSPHAQPEYTPTDFKLDAGSSLLIYYTGENIEVFAQRNGLYTPAGPVIEAHSKQISAAIDQTKQEPYIDFVALITAPAFSSLFKSWLSTAKPLEIKPIFEYLAKHNQDLFIKLAHNETLLANVLHDSYITAQIAEIIKSSDAELLQKLYMPKYKPPEDRIQFNNYIFDRLYEMRSSDPAMFESSFLKIVRSSSGLDFLAWLDKQNLDSIKKWLDALSPEVIEAILSCGAVKCAIILQRGTAFGLLATPYMQNTPPNLTDRLVADKDMSGVADAEQSKIFAYNLSKIASLIRNKNFAQVMQWLTDNQGTLKYILKQQRSQTLLLSSFWQYLRDNVHADPDDNIGINLRVYRFLTCSACIGELGINDKSELDAFFRDPKVVGSLNIDTLYELLKPNDDTEFNFIILIELVARVRSTFVVTVRDAFIDYLLDHGELLNKWIKYSFALDSSLPNPFMPMFLHLDHSIYEQSRIRILQSKAFRDELLNGTSRTRLRAAYRAIPNGANMFLIKDVERDLTYPIKTKPGELEKWKAEKDATQNAMRAEFLTQRIKTAETEIAEIIDDNILTNAHNLDIMLFMMRRTMNTNALHGITQWLRDNPIAAGYLLIEHAFVESYINFCIRTKQPGLMMDFIKLLPNQEIRQVAIVFVLDNAYNDESALSILFRDELCLSEFLQYLSRRPELVGKYLPIILETINRPFYTLQAQVRILHGDQLIGINQELLNEYYAGVMERMLVVDSPADILSPSSPYHAQYVELMPYWFANPKSQKSVKYWLEKARKTDVERLRNWFKNPIVDAQINKPGDNAVKRLFFDELRNSSPDYVRLYVFPQYDNDHKLIPPNIDYNQRLAAGLFAKPNTKLAVTHYLSTHGQYFPFNIEIIKQLLLKISDERLLGLCEWLNSNPLMLKHLREHSSDVYNKIQAALQELRAKYAAQAARRSTFMSALRGNQPKEMVIRIDALLSNFSGPTRARPDRPLQVRPPG